MFDPYPTLIELADKYIAIGQLVLAMGQEVVPVAVGVWPDERIHVAGMVGTSNAEQRAAVLRGMATEGAIGVLFFGDINIRDAKTMQKIGDGLHAYIELKDGRSTARISKYTPHPLVFEPITSTENAMWIHPIFDRTKH